MFYKRNLKRVFKIQDDPSKEIRFTFLFKKVNQLLN